MGEAACKMAMGFLGRFLWEKSFTFNSSSTGVAASALVR
jgi:hypothetical protein